MDEDTIQGESEGALRLISTAAWKWAPTFFFPIFLAIFRDFEIIAQTFKKRADFEALENDVIEAPSDFT